METVIERQNFVKRIMDKGFLRAAEAFSRMINREVSGSHQITAFVMEQETYVYPAAHDEEYFVLTTHLVGHLPGKSYLILTQEEGLEIYQSLFPKGPLNKEMQQALLLELDNIVSASVVSELANGLHIKLYGGVPKLECMSWHALQHFLTTDAGFEDATSMIVSNTTFVFGEQESIHPKFIWKLSPRILELVDEGLNII